MAQRSQRKRLANTLETDLKELKDEVSYHHNNPTYEPDDRFLVVMEPFLQEITQSFDKMQEAKIEMKQLEGNNIVCSVII